MADDFEALRSIRSADVELDPERAARMRARALAGVFGDVTDGSDSAVSLLTDVPARASAPSARPARRGRRGRPDHVIRLDPQGPTTEIRLDRRPDEPARDGGRSSAAGPSGRRSFLVLAAAAAIVAVVVGVGLARAGDRAGVVADQPQPTSVADVASNAATLIDRPLAAGDEAYLSVEEGSPFRDLDGTETTHVVTREFWSSGDGSGRYRYSAVDIVDGSGHTVGTYDVASDSGDLATTAGFGAFGYEGLRSLPTDPATLRSVLESGELVRPSENTTAKLLGDLLVLDATPPAVRAAALQLLADGGATLLDVAVDHGGRSGLGIVHERADGFTTVYVVTRDGILVGSYTVVTGNALDPANATAWQTVLEQRRDAIGD